MGILRKSALAQARISVTDIFKCYLNVTKPEGIFLAPRLIDALSACVLTNDYTCTLICKQFEGLFLNFFVWKKKSIEFN